jgi:hypothetical protein
MGIRESIKGRSFHRNTDSVDHSSSSLNSQQLVITPANEEPIVIVGPSEKTTSLLRLLRRMWQTIYVRDFLALGMKKDLLKNTRVIRAR